MKSEKWVVVQAYWDYSGIVDVHGIFDSKQDAENWVSNQGSSYEYEVKRIRKAVTDEWA